MSEIVVAIPTYRRPRMLENLLNKLAEMEASSVAVLVADNDAEFHEGYNLCLALAPKYKWPLQAVISEVRGIAQVRNTLVCEALNGPQTLFIAMIDDDEWPDPQWINTLIRVQSETGADVVQGSVFFAPEKGGSYSTPDIRGVTGRVAMLQGAGNLLLCADRLRKMARPWFDPQFALTGGEDADFFMRLKAEGATFAWADEARTYGAIAPSRETLRWVLTRAYSHGNSGMLVLLKYHPGISTQLVEIAKIAGALLLYLPISVALLLSSKRRVPLAKVWRAAGKMTALFGLAYKEYEITHGE